MMKAGHVSNLDKALQNAEAFAAEVLRLLEASSKKSPGKLMQAA